MLTEILDRLNVLVNEHVWVTQVFIVVFLVLFTIFLLRRLLKRLEVKLEETPNPWDDAFLYSVRRPLGLLVWIVGLAFAAQLSAPEAGTIISDVSTGGGRIGYSCSTTTRSSSATNIRRLLNAASFSSSNMALRMATKKMLRLNSSMVVK